MWFICGKDDTWPWMDILKFRLKLHWKMEIEIYLIIGRQKIIIINLIMN